MAIDGYREYRKREFCRDVTCPVQVQMNSTEPGSEDYEKIHKECKDSCRFTTRQFHYWLIEKGFLIIKSDKEEDNNAVGKEKQAVKDNSA